MSPHGGVRSRDVINMLYVVSIDAEYGCTDCSGIRYLCLNDGTRISREQAHFRVGKEEIRSGSPYGPKLLPANYGSTKYIRTESNDTPTDNLLMLPRTCK